MHYQSLDVDDDNDEDDDDANIKNLNWLTSQIKALETNLKDNTTLNSNSNTTDIDIITNSKLEDLLENNSSSKSHFVPDESDITTQQQHIHQQGTYKHKLDMPLSDNVDYFETFSELDQREIKWVLNELIEKLCQLNEAKPKFHKEVSASTSSASTLDVEVEVEEEAVELKQSDENMQVESSSKWNAFFYCCCYF